jgi:hypothetical protein
MKLMLIGDTHGNVAPLAHKLQIAQSHGIEHAFVLGDFGILPGMGGIVFIDEINRHANNHKVNLWAIPGNHENHDQWDAWLSMPGLPKENGFVAIRSRVWISPKVNTFVFGRKRWMVMGGAVSIDRRWRREGESWWPNETFSEKNLASVLDYKGKPIDYVLSHDCSNRTPWGFQLVPDPLSQENRERIDRALDHIQPKMHFHGHMHRKYDWKHPAGPDYENPAWIQTYGLDCDGEIDSWGILDTSDDSFLWGSRVYGEL